MRYFLPGWVQPIHQAGEVGRVSVAIVTDSASALPDELRARHQLSVVPLGLAIGGAAVDEASIELGEVLARFSEGVSTSGASPGDFAAAIEGADRGDGVLVVTMAADLSSTHQAAQIAATTTASPVSVLDSATAAGAEALVVLAAARMAEQGASLGEVTVEAKRVASAVRLAGSMSSLDHLVAGGHLPAAAGWAGGRLHLNPVIELRDGRVRPLRPARSAEAACRRIVERCLRERSSARLHVVAMHVTNPPAAEELLDRVKSKVPPATSLVCEFSIPLAVHAGPGLVGLAWHWEEG